jgi:DNA-binding CsgD family transcriptional regulator
MIFPNLYIFRQTTLIILFFYIYHSSLGSEIYIKNYSKQEYHASNQNWSVAEDDNGYMYFANHQGLLVFDGISWTLYPSKDNTAIRAVAVDKNNRVFTAGYRELGYWERNELDELEYYSLKKEVESSFTSNEEFWNVIISEGQVYFQSFSKIIIYDYNKFSIISQNGFINAISDVGNSILVSVMNDGIYEIEGITLVPYFLNSFFINKEVRFILPIGLSQKLIGIANHGLYLLEGQKITSWNENEDEYFKKNIINRACQTTDGKIIIGTILDGISIFEHNGKLINRINKTKGLQNNTVLGIYSDKSQNIWLSLDKGIDYIPDYTEPSYTIIQRSEIGAVYCAAIFEDILYLGTNQGLYRRAFADQNEAFQIVQETQGQVWDCKVIDDCLFVNHNSGTFIIKGAQLNKISSISGGFSITRNPIKPNILIQSTYSNLIFYKKDSSKWKLDKVNYQFNELIRFLEVDHYGNFWASHLYRGIFRLRFDDNDRMILNHYYGNEVFGQDNDIHVFMMENRIVFTTGKQLYTYDDIRDSIVPYKSANQQFDQFKKATRIISAPEHHYWLITNESLGLFKVQNTEIIKIKEYPNQLFNNNLIIGYENIIPISAKKAILCLENGYAILNADTISSSSQIVDKKPILRRISSINSDEQIFNLPINTEEVKLSYSQNNLQIRFSFPYFMPDYISYQSFIEGLDEKWSQPIAKPIFNFKWIPSGQYKIRIRATNNWGEQSAETILKLKVMYPWYGSSVAIILYTLFISIGMFFFRKNIIMRTRLKEARGRREKEHELIQLRHEKLQIELSYKSSELANSALAIIRKNEFLLDLKDILDEQKNQLGTRYPDKYYDIFAHKIKDNMTQQDSWKVFEINFERAHEAFIIKLKNNYPDLTPNDIRLCAFLRMNLSSKDIAPLMGISFRGIENHRYRLRKKFNLESDSNLTDFLIRF